MDYYGETIEEDEEYPEEEELLSESLSDEEDGDRGKKPDAERIRQVLLPAIQSRVTALGGFEDIIVRRRRQDRPIQVDQDRSSDVEEDDEENYEDIIIKTYKLGDEALGCLKDLKRFWRMDDSDDERNISKLFFETGVLKNDLLNILNLAGQPDNSIRQEKAALASADLIAAMTWPINAQEELKEISLTGDKDALKEALKIDYSTLIVHQRAYKMAILKSGAIKTLFRMLIPKLQKGLRDRTERDENVISLILHIFRNLAAIRDRALSTYQSAEAFEEAHLQSELICQMASENVFDLLITISSLSDKTQFNQWNMICLEIFFLLFRGVEKPESLIKKSEEATKVVREEKLSKLLDAENSRKRLATKSGLNTRHSRFGTTVVIENRISGALPTKGKTGASAPVKVDRIVMHKQSSISTAVLKNPGQVLDANKRKRRQREKILNDLAPYVELRPEAIKSLQGVALSFLESAFNPFFGSVMRDIRMERAKVREIDNTRFLFLVRFFLEYFLALYKYERTKGIPPEDESAHDFGLIAEMTETTSIVHVLTRMKTTMEEKPPLWTELHAAVDCFVQMLLTIDALYYSGNEEYKDVAEILQNKLYYEPEFLDTLLQVVRSYKDQPLMYLDATMHLSYVLLRMLEKYSKNKEFMFVKKKASRRKKNQRDADDDGEMLEEPQDEEEAELYEASRNNSYSDHQFQFRAFEAKFASESVTKTVITYLSGYKEFTDDEQMKRCVNLMHRAAIKAESEALFFKATTLALFRRILDDRALLPRTAPYNDLGKVITFILKKFFKLAQDNPLLLLEVFYSHNKTETKKFIYNKEDSEEESDDDGGFKLKGTKVPAELLIKGDFSWSQQVGIAVAVLSDAGRDDLLTWVKDTLSLVAKSRSEKMSDYDNLHGTRKTAEDLEREEDEDEETFQRRLMVAAMSETEPSEEAKTTLEDHVIISEEEEINEACTRNSQLKLLLNLLKWLPSESEDKTHVVWKIPADQLPKDLQSHVKLIDDFLIEPLDMENGLTAKQMVKKKVKRRPKKVIEFDGSELPDGEDDEVEFSDPEVQAAIGGSKRSSTKGKGKKRSKANEGGAEDSSQEPSKRRKKRMEEAKIYRTAEFILDSDDDEETDRLFFEREARLRKDMEMNAGKGNGIADREAITKTKKAKRGEKKAAKKRSNADASDSSDDDMDATQGSEIGVLAASKANRPRPRPVPVVKSKARDPEPPSATQTSSEPASSPPTSASVVPAKRSKAIPASGDEADSDEQNSPQGKRQALPSSQAPQAINRGRRVVLDSDDED